MEFPGGMLDNGAALVVLQGRGPTSIVVSPYHHPATYTSLTALSFVEAIPCLMNASVVAQLYSFVAVMQPLDFPKTDGFIRNISRFLD